MHELIVDSFAGGNSVCPPMAAALVAANYRPDEAEPAPEFMEAAE